MELLLLIFLFYAFFSKKDKKKRKPTFYEHLKYKIDRNQRGYS